MFLHLFLGLVATTGISGADISRGYWILTPTVREEFQNGSNGFCEYGGEDGNSPTCESKWINIGTSDGQLVGHNNGCRYFSKTTTYICRHQEGKFGFPKEVCVRKIHFYQLRSECYGQWLQWSNCVIGDSQCSAGVSWRFQFHNSLSFKYQTRSCLNPNVPTWGKWVEPAQECGDSCTKMWSRKCYLNKQEISSINCPMDSFSGTIGNSTHVLLPCVKSSCTIARIPNPFPLEITIDGSSAPAPPPVPTLPPTIPQRQADEVEPTLFSLGAFWIGFCVGMAAAFAILLFVCCVYLNTWKGKLTIEAIKTYRRNEKLYYDRKRRQDVDDPSERKRTNSRVSVNYSRSSIRRDSDFRAREPSMHSYPSWRRDEGYKSYPASGSISGHSKYQESLAQPAFGTYYTPNGESKLLTTEGRRSTHIVHSNMGSPNASRYDSFESDSGPESLYDSPRALREKGSSHASLEVKTGGLFHEKQSGSHGQKHGGKFDEDAYMRSYKAYRAERMRETPAKHSLRRSKSPHKTPRKEINSNTRSRSWKDSKGRHAPSSRPFVQEVGYAKVNRKPTYSERQQVKRRPSPKPHHAKVVTQHLKLQESFSEDIQVSRHDPISSNSPTESVEGLDFPPPPATFYEENAKSEM